MNNVRQFEFELKSSNKIIVHGRFSFQDNNRGLQDKIWEIEGVIRADSIWKTELGKLDVLINPMFLQVNICRKIAKVINSYMKGKKGFPSHYIIERTWKRKLRRFLLHLLSLNP